MHEHVTEELRLGFGKCALQVQVPEAGSIKTVEDLVETGCYKGGKRTKIYYVSGSVEAACALWLADGIGEILLSALSSVIASLTIAFAIDLAIAIATVSETEAVLIKSRIPEHQETACYLLDLKIKFDKMLDEPTLVTQMLTSRHDSS
ncbi:hypothetical protein C8J55DRAFT_562724 [Lentinula edodes]|uniref:ATP phosphoribosyltransferase catalytic domain-containing protein n=1 Tax=Lentinula lateritia TaxID=40482 RepID=A0A9W9DJW5_9AGAR|nr:hypothetical protein C8J55DRAFT_562724 [Lentinula edodes]